MYDLYLMDADDTLLDFRSAEAAAFGQACGDLGLRADEAVYLRYRQINKDLWEKLERGEIGKAALLPLRFALLAEEFGLSADAEAMNRVYLQRLSERGDTVEGAQEVLEALLRRADIAIVTNGVASAQRGKLARSGLLRYVRWLIISEEVGAEKPSRAFFEAAMAICGRTEKEGVLVVGDSPGADIRGAREYGLDSCLVDPDNLHPDCSCTYRIRSLRELPGLGAP